MKFQTHRAKRIVAAASVLAAAGIMPLVAAAPASASVSACANTIGMYGYAVGPKVKAACSNAAIYTPAGKQMNPWCWGGLIKAGVKQDHVYDACLRA